MGIQRALGFTLIEMIMVILLLGILSVVSVSLLPSKDQYTTRLATDQWLTFFRLGQRLSFIKQDAIDLLRITISENGNRWDASIQQGTELLQQSEIERENVQLKITTTDFSSSCTALTSDSLPQTYYLNGDGNLVTATRAAITVNTRFCLLGAGETQEMCLAPSGYFYSGACLP